MYKSLPPVPLLSQINSVHVPHTSSLRSIIIFFSHLRLGLPGCLCPSGGKIILRCIVRKYCVDCIHLSRVKSQLPGFVNRLVPLDVLDLLTAWTIDEKTEVVRVRAVRALSRNSSLTPALDELSGQHRAPAVLLPKKNSAGHWIGVWAGPEPVWTFSSVSIDFKTYSVPCS